jgi:hypothetical protein
MTDKELLELAAKAAGIDGEYVVWRIMGMKEGIRKPSDKVSVPWNPLTDDGDALRLAVKMNLIVHKGFVYTPTGKLLDHRDYANPTAATRRAIVRAAAEIGKAKCE